ncbi:plasmid replication initiator TrfA [Dechloromonas agitata]|uniref:plasmid replication initiator TrfA n=1 Tax=Dechloromonas agitata TaxID=73030 RepID=UPI0018DF181F|nr:plasmid replication initiator TrfA [Dechloromonas agitata]
MTFHAIHQVEQMRQEAPYRQRYQGFARAPANENEEVALSKPLSPWADKKRGVPNGFLRSALFGAIAKGRRRYVDGEDLAAVDGVTIRYKGERLDQGDLDVWESVLHAVRLQELGSQCRVTSYALLKLMGKTDTGKNRATLHVRIERLVANALTVKQGRYTYIGGLIRFASKDEDTQEWVIELDAKLRPLFAADQFTQVEWAVRRALAGKPLAQWLHGFYSSHAKPFPMKVGTLLRLCGSESELRRYRQTLGDALDAVAEASAANGEDFRYEIRGDLVHVEKQAKGAQLRHLAKKASNPQKPRG